MLVNNFKSFTILQMYFSASYPAAPFSLLNKKNINRNLRVKNMNKNLSTCMYDDKYCYKEIQWNNVGTSTYHFHLLLLLLFLLLLLLLGFGRDGQNGRGYLPWEERAEMFPPRETIQ